MSGFRTAAGGFELVVEGQVHRGWLAAKLNLTMEAIAGKFDVRLAERWTRVADAPPRVVKPGAPCTVKLDGEEMLVGYIDSVSVDYDHQAHTLNIKGREKTGDVVDCAAVVNGAHELRGVTVLEIAQRLCRPFGVNVTASVPVGARFPRWAIQPGESAFEAIDRALRARAMLAVSDGKGNLVLTKAGGQGAAAGPLVLGGERGNIRGAKGEFDWSKRHNLVVVRGQAEVMSLGVSQRDVGSTAPFRPETDPGFSPLTREDRRGAQAGQRRGSAKDDAVRRYRPLVIIAESADGGSTPTQRAEWEVSVRRARSRRVTYTVPGWRGSTGALWRINTLAQVRDEYLGIAEDMLITAITYAVGKDGSTTELEVTSRDAWNRIFEVKRGDGLLAEGLSQRDVGSSGAFAPSRNDPLAGRRGS